MKSFPKLVVFMLLILSFNNIFAAKIEYKATANFFVNDFANVLSDETENQIYTIGKTVETKTTAQIVVVTVPNMNGDYIESYANTLFNKWGIGNKEKNNGVLIIIAKEERKIRIEVGYGLEGSINDAKAGRILDEYALPYLANDLYDKAITATLTQVQGEVYTEYGIDNSIENPNYVPETPITIDAKYILIAIGIFIFLIVITKGKILEVLLWVSILGGRGGSSGGGSFGGGGSSGGGGASRGF